MAINLTEAAVKSVKEILKSQNATTGTFLRLGVKGGGCSGLEFELRFDDTIGGHDKVFPDEKMRQDGIEWGFLVVVDAKSYLYLTGSTIDYETVGLKSNFVVKNPNAKSTCGCGTSFST